MASSSAMSTASSSPISGVDFRGDPALQAVIIPSVHLTGRIIGQGAYGVVVEADTPGATCAVKKLHDVFQTEEVGWVDGRVVEESRTKFIRECQLMSSLRHPHIVQFLGVCFLPGSNTPALVMEKLLTNLHTLLLTDKKTECLPYIPLGLKYSILHDVARGLSFLHNHSPPIIHRDLTARNVLLNSAMVAKIADLGVARLMPTVRAAMTKGPGNSVYMPPEAHGDAYDVSMDVFSFGVLALFTLTQTFPDPLPATYSDAEGKVVGRTEMERRSVYIDQLHSQLHSDQSVICMAEKCLANLPAQRPKIEDVVKLLATSNTVCPNEHIAMDRLELLQVIEKKEREIEETTRQKEREKKESVRRRENEIVEEMMRELGMEEDETLTGESVKTNKDREPKQDSSFPLPTDGGRYSLYEVIQPLNHILCIII